MERIVLTQLFYGAAAIAFLALLCWQRRKGVELAVEVERAMVPIHFRTSRRYPRRFRRMSFGVLPPTYSSKSRMASIVELCASDLCLDLVGYLTRAEMQTFGIAHPSLAARLALRTILPQLALFFGPADPRRSAPRLMDVLLQGHVSAEDVLDSIVADVLRGGKTFDQLFSLPDRSGQVPLLVALQRRQVAAVDVLLRLSKYPDVVDTASGWSPLMFAVSNGDVRMVELLYAHGASVNFIARPHGDTPLMAALGVGNEKLAGWLLVRGADHCFTRAALRANLSHFRKEYEILNRIVRKF
eukprot:CAMPEP_0117512028 /NCGR_PEP_ID=MMETSP0784-20121206/28817_1 /TAXON_ID=39447 /ORGANISM="" /LENGTH=298 /DNA_ID=CAMNT_0005307729 /DNA_START=44 /DNA_END=940 /DNA_ORIENTATION=-